MYRIAFKIIISKMFEFQDKVFHVLSNTCLSKVNYFLYILSYIFIKIIILS